MSTRQTSFHGYFLPRHLLSLAFAAALQGCGVTPTVSVDASGMAVQVRAKAPLVIGATFSPDGRNLATTSSDNVIRLWSPTSASLVASFKDLGALQGPVAYSPDGKWIAVASAGGVTVFSDYITRVLEVATGKVYADITGFSGRIAFSPDSKALLGSFGAGKLKVWDLPTRRFTHELDGSSGLFSPDGRQILVNTLKSLDAFDAGTGRRLWKADISGNGGTKSVSDGHFVTAYAYSPNGKAILAALFFYTTVTSADTSFIELDAATGSQARRFGAGKLQTGFFGLLILQAVTELAMTPDGAQFVTGSNAETGRYQVRDMKAGAIVRELRANAETAGTLLNNAFAAVTVSPDGKVGLVTTLASIQTFELATGRELGKFIGFEGGEWLITTPSGYYSSSEGGDRYLDVQVGGTAYSLSQLRESFQRPDLVKLSIAGRSMRDFRTLAEITRPPLVSIVDTPATSSEEQVTVSVSVRDQGGGIGDVRLYRNGTAVLLEKTRMSVAAAGGAEQVLRYPVLLEPGKNVIRAVAFNGDNSMQSLDAQKEIQASVAVRAPALYAIVVGIQEFANSRLNLKYPVADAQLFARTLETQGKGLFSSIRVRRLVKPEETTNTAIVAALAQAQKEVRPEELFVFYVASHGTVDDGQYLLLTSNVGSTSSARLKVDALAQGTLKDMISNVPASKKLIVLDTCNAGQLGDALQVALLTRGLNEDTAVKLLARAVGSTVLSAATSVQEALEGYKEHGLFTWVVVEGLMGAADKDRDGFVKTLELADYVDSRVPEIAEQVFGHKQYPIVSPSGQGFPLTRSQ